MTELIPGRVSVIMPCYNAASHLPKSIGSVLSQTYPDWELIIGNDGSTDDSWKILQEYAARDQRIKIFHHDNVGMATTRNRALTRATGVYTAFLDSDDTWHPEFLAEMTRSLVNHPDAGIAYCGWQNLGLGGGRDEPFIPLDYENEHKIESLLGGCRWPIHGALIYTQALREIGGFDENLRNCHDYDLWMRMSSLHKLVLVPRVLVYYHHHGGQTSVNKASIAINHWLAQMKYVRDNPGIVQRLGNKKIRQLTHGELLNRGYATYWKRDIPAARKIFRLVMKQGYGSAKDWLYMLPSLLPESWHRLLIQFAESDQKKGA